MIPTTPVNPFTDDTVIMEVAEELCAILRDVGFVMIVKPDTLIDTFTLWSSDPLVPSMSTL